MLTLAALLVLLITAYLALPLFWTTYHRSGRDPQYSIKLPPSWTVESTALGGAIITSADASTRVIIERNLRLEDLGHGSRCGYLCTLRQIAAPARISEGSYYVYSSGTSFASWFIVWRMIATYSEIKS